MQKKRLISVILVLLLLIAPVSSLAAEKEGITYTALGDSIAFGTGGTGLISYVDLMEEHLARIYGEVTMEDWAANGETSSILLNHIYYNYHNINDDIAAAEVITISIGGNDILQPVILLDPSDPDIYEDLMALVPVLTANVTSFASNWASIIAQIRIINPDADIYVNTLYNPFNTNPAFHDLADPLIDGINAPIWALASTFDYKVADVYGKFEDYNNPKKLLVHDIYDLSPEKAYLHPTDLGYCHILNLHKDLLD